MFLSKSSDETMSVFRFNSVKIILLKSDIIALTLRNRRFYNAKPTLLPCKTYGLRTQNNRFCNALKTKDLSEGCVCEKYLRIYAITHAIHRLHVAHYFSWRNGWQQKRVRTI